MKNDAAQERAYLWLCACTDTAYRERVALLRAASPAELLERAEEIFPAVLPEARGKFSALPAREREADACAAYLKKKGYFAVTLLSEDYPEALKHTEAPPLVLYGAGNRALLSERKFCIVGSRKIPPWAEKLGRTVAEQLAEKFVVVTGLAEGGDCAAIAGAASSGNLISVLPCGLDECYPVAHTALKERIRTYGLILSEYPPAERARKFYFPARNRILAGLSEGVLVLSAAVRSGALITADLALEYGRDVFAFPHNVGAAQGEGCNELIKKGAYVATGAEDILSVYGIEPAPKRETQLSEEEEKLLHVLRERGELHLAELANLAGMRIFEASAVLSALEIKGVAVKAGGNRYTAV